MENFYKKRSFLTPLDCLIILLVYLPFLKTTQEVKTKIAQQGVEQCRSLGINPDIETRLGISFSSFCSYKNSDYLNGAINQELRFLKLDNELKLIAEKCTDCNIKLFTHSMQAVNFICQGGQSNGEDGN